MFFFGGGNATNDTPEAGREQDPIGDTPGSELSGPGIPDRVPDTPSLPPPLPPPTVGGFAPPSGPAAVVDTPLTPVKNETPVATLEPRDAVLALDIGGSGFSAGIVTFQGQLIDRSEVEVDRDAGPQSQLTNLAAIIEAQIERAERHHRVQLRSVGIASNGPINQRNGTVSPNSLTMWKRFALRDHVAELTQLPTFLELDARALALAEGWLSSARGLSNFAVIVVSTGVEGALVIDGELVDGASHHAGQIGHVIVNSGGRRCTCGSRGCLEAETSSLAIEALTGRPASEPTYEIMQRTGRYVGRAAANVCNSLDIDLVIVGGSVAMNFAATFFNSAQDELDRLANLGIGQPRITRTRLGSHGTLLGAGAVGIRGLRRSRRQPAA